MQRPRRGERVDCVAWLAVRVQHAERTAVARCMRVAKAPQARQLVIARERTGAHGSARERTGEHGRARESAGERTPMPISNMASVFYKCQ